MDDATSKDMDRRFKEKEEFKRTNFDQNLRLLIKQSIECIESRYKVSLELGEIRPELVAIKKYLSIYGAMTPEEHYQYFETLYNRKRISILNTLNDDRWLRTGGVVIQFGDGIKGVSEKCKAIRIMLSEIYLIACELQQQAEKISEGGDEQFAEMVGGKDLIRRNILLLHLFRIFYYLNDGSDKEELGKIVTHLEDDLGITKKTVPSNKVAVSSSGLGIDAGAANGGLSSLFTMATSMMEKMGYKPPEGMKPPTESEITNVISTVFNSDATQNTIQTMFASLQNCQDFSSAVQTVVKNVADPATMEAIQSSVTQTAQLAQQNIKQNE